MSANHPRCSVGYSTDAHMPHGVTWYVTYMPHGYAPDKDNVLICAIPDQPGWERYGLGIGMRPPLIKAICEAVERHYAASKQEKEG